MVLSYVGRRQTSHAAFLAEGIGAFVSDDSQAIVKGGS
jgi:hypothetical protein